MNLSLMPKPDVLAQLGCKNTQIYREINAGTMTPGIAQGRRKVVWPAYEIDAICRAKIAGMTIDERRMLVQQLIAQRVQMKPVVVRQADRSSAAGGEITAA